MTRPHKHQMSQYNTTKKTIVSINKVTLIPLNCSFGVVTKKDTRVFLEDAVKSERKKEKGTVTIVFAVRRPGCGGCREHGLQLKNLWEQEKKLQGVALMGIVKESGVDDAALLEFNSKYFPFPLYQDSEWKVYKALGGRKITTLHLLRGFFSSLRRHKENKIQTKMGPGDGFVQGGILVFDKNGELRYVEHEIYGKLFDLEALVTAAEEARTPLSAAVVEKRKPRLEVSTSLTSPSSVSASA